MKKNKSKKHKKHIDQLELPMERPREPDRNSAIGGRSFYFFDLDDNVFFLPTPLFLFHRETGEEKRISTQEFSRVAPHLGKEGEWREYELKLDPQTGSFRKFRQRKIGLIEKLTGAKQPIVEDVLAALAEPTVEWRGPSWNFFWHAVHNSRPLSIITARGHHPSSIKDAIKVLKKIGHLSREPNYLSIFPVSNADVRIQLGDHEEKWSTAQLKKEAIRFSVEEAFKVYGLNHGHRFGMSDDDPHNIKLIIEAMQEMKRKYPQNSFHVIDTHGGRLLKHEVLNNSVRDQEIEAADQLKLFE